MKQTILVIEDDPILLEGIRDILGLAGYHVLAANNGLEALQALEGQERPDLIISDIMMPRMNGYSFYEAVRAHPEWVAIPFIFLTARGEKADVRLGKQLGVDDYIVKPFEAEDLLVAIAAKLRRTAELRAVQEQEIASLKRSILTMLNHEFRTPLTYIMAYAEMLSEDSVNADYSEASQFREFLQGIRKGSHRLQRLVEDFIFLVELETGEARKTYEARRRIVADLRQLIAGVVADWAEVATARNLNLVTDVPECLPPILADTEYLRNALERLLDNACKFSWHGTIEVRACDHEEPGGRAVCIAVSDQGIGIAADDLPHIFSPFYQGDRAKTEQQGSGSGLAIAKGIVELHGGHIEVESQPGVGSTFTIVLPGVNS